MRRTRWLLVPVTALAGLLALAAPSVAQTRLSPDAFLDRLQRAQELARLEGQGASRERMADLRATLGLPVEVVIGEWSVEVGTDPLLGRLSGESTSDFERASARLEALERSLADALAREPPSSGRIAQALAEAYRGVVPPRPNPLDAVLQTVRDVVEAILQRVGRLVGEAGTALAWIVLLAIVGVGAVFLVRSRLVPDRVATTDTTGRGATRSVDWAARAEEALRAGDLQEAVRALYLAMLAVLAGRGIVADAPALTAGEARLAVRRARPALFPAIARATDSYERVIYGGAAPELRDVEHLREATVQARKP